MSRLTRIDIPNKYYHIYSRGQDKQLIFRNAKDYFTFLKYLNEYLIKSDLDLNAYCLMPNHFHILVYQRQDSISDFMHKLLTRYALYFNETHDHVGHVFQGRFNSKIVTDKKYLKNILYYIHQNPVRGGLIDEEEQYPYSTSQYYNGKKSNFCLVKINGFKTDKSGKRYMKQKKVFNKSELKIFDFFIGDKNEYLILEKRKPGREKSKFIEKRKSDQKNILLALKGLTENYQILIKRNSYHISEEKIRLIVELYKKGFSKSSIARLFKYTPTTISKLIKKHIKDY